MSGSFFLFLQAVFVNTIISNRQNGYLWHGIRKFKSFPPAFAFRYVNALISYQTTIMFPVLLQIHSILRWVILILLVLSIVQSFIGWIKKRELREGDTKLWLFTMIFAHTTLLIGLILLFFGSYGILSSWIA